MTEDKSDNAKALLQYYDLDPLSELARLTVDAKKRNDDLAVEALCKFLAPYIYPKKRAHNIQSKISVSEEQIVLRLKRGRERIAKNESISNSGRENDFSCTEDIISFI